MPLRRLKDPYILQDGVRFLMADEIGNTVACRVSHEALRDHADRVHLSGTDSAIFEAYRELIEDVASKTFDAEKPFDEHGRILVTSEARGRRAAPKRKRPQERVPRPLRCRRRRGVVNTIKVSLSSP
jgi:hypothetical protein